MVEQIRLLQAEIKANLDSIAEVYHQLDELGAQATGSPQDKSIRPPVISQEAYLALNELRSFRHLFRNAYLLQFDPDRLNLVLREAIALKSIYEAEINAFLDFLEQLAQTDS